LSSSSEITDALTLADVDHDGALLEAVANVYGSSRAEFLRGAAFAGGAVALGLALPSEASASPKQDVGILQFDLVFEYLQSTFYLSAVRERTVEAMNPAAQQWAHVLGAHELAHVKILKKVLARHAVGKPFFDFHGVTERPTAFTKTAVAMEDLTVALLSGQAPRFKERGLAAAVLSLLTVEARHAAWARHIVGVSPVASAFDEPKSLAEVDQVVRSTRFVAARPRTRSRKNPRLTG
jgi:hypothetical protein